MTVPIGLYHPGSSVLHRLPAGVKLAGMLVGVIVVVLLPQWWQLATAATVVAALFALARIPLHVAAAQLRPVLLVVVAVGLLQLLLAGWMTAVMVCGAILLTVAIAALVTLTTRTGEILDTVEALLRPLGRLGIRTDRVGLVLAMTIRAIPLLVGIVTSVNEARKARGVGFSVRALAAPVIIRALRAADGMGESLLARGVDD